MPKIPSRQILAAKLDKLLGEGQESNNALAGRAKIAQSHIGRMRRQESAATIDMLDALADAFGMEPWELLTDSEMTRRNAIERMLLGPRAPDERVASHLPPAPKHEAPKSKAAAPKHRKRKKKDDS